MIDKELFRIILHPKDIRMDAVTPQKRLALPGALLFAAMLVGSGAVNAQVGDPGIVSYKGSAIGIDGETYSGPGNDWPGHREINHNPLTCESQALALDWRPWGRSS